MDEYELLYNELQLVKGQLILCDESLSQEPDSEILKTLFFKLKTKVDNLEKRLADIRNGD